MRGECSGMPGVSGDENVKGPPICARLAKLPEVVPCALDEGLSAPSNGRSKRSLFGLVLLDWIMGEPSLHMGKKLTIARRWDCTVRDPYAGTNRIRFHGYVSAPGNSKRHFR